MSSLSQLMMENRTPKSIASATSTVRGHSPYCEATGPIVHEGFVAARVRAIQAKFDETPQNLSHSPLIPCPVPRWFQITDPITPPRSLSSGRRKSSQKRAINTRSTTLPSRSFEPLSSTMKAAMAPGEVDIAPIRFSKEAIGKDENVISSPKPVLPITTSQYDGWPYPYRGEGFQNSSADFGTSLQAPNSVADRLVSLVDRGWVGCDVFGKAYSDRRTSDNYASSEHSEKFDSGERYAKWETSHKGLLPVRGRLYPERNNHAYYRDQVANQNERHSSQESTIEPIEKRQQRLQGFENRSESDSNVHARIDSSEFDRSQVSDTENCRPSNHLHGKSRRHHRSFMDCQSQLSEFDKLSLSQEIDRHLSQWENTRAVDHERSELAKLETTDLQVDGQLQTSSKTSNTEDECLAAMNMQDPKEPPIRSASWFSKLAGFKLVLMDKAPIMQVLSRRTSEPAIGSTGVQHHYQPQQEMKQQPASTSNVTETCGNEALTAKSEPKNFLLKSDEPKARSESTTGKDRTTVEPTIEPTIEESVHIPAPPLHRNLSSISASPSRSSQVTLSLLSPPQEVQEHTTSRVNGEKPSKFASTKEHQMEESITASRVATTPRVAQKPYERRSGSSNSEFTTKSNIAEVDESQTAKTVLPRLKSAVSVHSLEGEMKNTKKSAQWEVAGNGRGIKRVQVIVSLDGADDLMIDAKLLKTPEKENESRIEEVANVDNEKIGDSCCQDFF